MEGSNISAFTAMDDVDTPFSLEETYRRLYYREKGKTKHKKILKLRISSKTQGFEGSH